MEHLSLPYDEVVRAILLAVLALATAWVSVWRDRNKATPAEEEEFGISGWALVSLATLTCVIGVWSAVADVRSSREKDQQIHALQMELTETHGDVKKAREEAESTKRQLLLENS